MDLLARIWPFIETPVAIALAIAFVMVVIYIGVPSEGNRE